MTRCPLCGVAAHACGPRGAVTPVDSDYPMRKDQIMALTEYTVMKNGVETTMLLSEAHAKRLGITGKTTADASTADASTADASTDDGEDKASAPVSTAARTTRNKARNETR